MRVYASEIGSIRCWYRMDPVWNPAVCDCSIRNWHVLRCRSVRVKPGRYGFDTVWTPVRNPAVCDCSISIWSLLWYLQRYVFPSFPYQEVRMYLNFLYVFPTGHEIGDCSLRKPFIQLSSIYLNLLQVISTQYHSHRGVRITALFSFIFSHGRTTSDVAGYHRFCAHNSLVR
jgi:hypothetical protein